MPQRRSRKHTALGSASSPWTLFLDIANAAAQDAYTGTPALTAWHRNEACRYVPTQSLLRVDLTTAEENFGDRHNSWTSKI